MSRRQLIAEEAEERAAEKAIAFLAEHGQRLVLALDRIGWKIVRQEPCGDNRDKYPMVFHCDRRIKGEIPAWVDLFEADPRFKRPSLRLIVDNPTEDKRP